MLTEIAGLRVEKAEPKGPHRKQPLLFIHGSGGGAWTWENFLGFFASRGYPCYALNLRGHHGSKPVSRIGRVSVHEHLSDVLETAKALGNPILIGHSLGGLIALKLAENQNPPAVVALSPAPPRGIFAVKSPAAILSFIRHLPRILFSRPILLGRDEAARLVMNGIPLQQQDALYARGLPQSGRLMFELTILGVPVDASKVRCPVLVVAGKDDRMTPSRIAKRIAEKYRADFREYTGHAHLLELEPGWKEIAHDIANWLERAI